MTRMHVIAVSTHPTAPERIEFDIDFAAARITNLQGTGINPEAVMMRLENWQSRFDGRIAFPWQQSYPAKPPLNDPQSLAWSLLAAGYALQGDLAAYPPPVPDPLPDGVLA